MNLILVGLHQVGLLGLREAFVRVDQADLREPQAIADTLADFLADKNFIPPHHEKSYRQALVREYKRYRGEDISDLYSEIEVVVRGQAGEELERFRETLTAAFAKFELRPLISLEPPEAGESAPELWIDGDVVVKGRLATAGVERALRKRITEW